MAKTKKRRRKSKNSPAQGSTSWGGPKASAAHNRRFYAGAAALIGAIAIIAAAYWWHQHRGETAFLALVAQGQGSLAKVVTHRDDGRRHFPPSQTHAYPSRFPTSGPHATIWVTPGFYNEPQRPTMLVHAAEHGNIVIYYDKPDAATLERLEDWVGLYTGRWDGMVATPMPGLGRKLVLTAWRKSLRVDSLDAAAAAFIDTYRGRGPENPVR